MNKEHLIQEMMQCKIIAYNEMTKRYELGKRYELNLQQNPNIIQRILEFTTFLQYPASIAVRIQCCIQGILCQPVCRVCSKPLKMRMSGKVKYTFSVFCCAKCMGTDITIKEKRKRTNHKKYGSSSFLSSDAGKIQREQTLVEKYGVDNPMHSPKLKDKKNATCKERFGVENVMLNEDIKQKQQDTVQERYGVRNVLCSESFIRQDIEQFK